ncbi:MAG: helix-hairpin-helix domain-containing protein [Nitrosomonas sp.]|nr:helix-hairpin-helix domain-containing protein [Nitrosomonas sp.]
MKHLVILLVSLLLSINYAIAAVNINTATHAELETLQGIGPAKATAIIEYREKIGAFTSIEELIAVDGIGPGTMKQLGDSITVGSPLETETTAAMAAPQQ